MILFIKFVKNSCCFFKFRYQLAKANGISYSLKIRDRAGNVEKRELRQHLLVIVLVVNSKLYLFHSNTWMLQPVIPFLRPYGLY